MGVYRKNEFERPEELEAIDFYRPSDICFKCGGVLDGDKALVYVHGCEGSPCKDSWDEVQGRYVDPEIWMHPDCAHDLALELLKDYLAVKQVRDRKEARKRLGLPPDPECDGK
jgi:hypothetical protein